mmetsp:Transcript_52505/g.166984  ORF Transcript_52505/g.166984 Transcript_52505/m.166984 type:complete len:205 (+) Transcript_52505:566-1180(+)
MLTVLTVSLASGTSAFHSACLVSSFISQMRAQNWLKSSRPLPSFPKCFCMNEWSGLRLKVSMLAACLTMEENSCMLTKLSPSASIILNCSSREDFGEAMRVSRSTNSSKSMSPESFWSAIRKRFRAMTPSISYSFAKSSKLSRGLPSAPWDLADVSNRSLSFHKRLMFVYSVEPAHDAGRGGEHELKLGTRPGYNIAIPREAAP